MTERDLRYEINPNTMSKTFTLPTRTQRAVAVLEQAKVILQDRGKGYIDEDVFADVALTDWLAQVLIKAHRARRATTLEKVEEELLDTLNYCALTITKIQDLKPQVATTTTKSGTYHICK